MKLIKNGINKLDINNIFNFLGYKEHNFTIKDGYLYCYNYFPILYKQENNYFMTNYLYNQWKDLLCNSNTIIIPDIINLHSITNICYLLINFMQHNDNNIFKYLKIIKDVDLKISNDKETLYNHFNNEIKEFIDKVSKYELLHTNWLNGQNLTKEDIDFMLDLKPFYSFLRMKNNQIECLIGDFKTPIDITKDIFIFNTNIVEKKYLDINIIKKIGQNEK